MNSRSTSTRTAVDLVATKTMLQRELEELENQIIGMSEELERCKQDRGRIQMLLRTIEAAIADNDSSAAPM